MDESRDFHSGWASNAACPWTAGRTATFCEEIAGDRPIPCTVIDSPADSPALVTTKRPPLTPEQKLEALARVQAQTEQRIALGRQLFKAAEARIRAESDVVKQVRRENEALKEQLHREFTESLHSYDQWVGQIDESFTTAIRALEQKIDAVASQSEADRRHVASLVARAEALLGQAQMKLGGQPYESHPNSEAA